MTRAGYHLWLVDLPGDDFRRFVRDQTKSRPTAIRFTYCDLESEDERVDLAQEVFKSGSVVSALINNAALVNSQSLKDWTVAFENQCLESWRRAMEINLTAPFHLSQLLAPSLRTSGEGSIVNIGSTHGFLAPRWALYTDTKMGSAAAYSVTKAGIIHLTRWLATTLAPQIRVNCVSPGGIYRRQPKSFVDSYERETPLGRMGDEGDIASAVSYLLSSDASYVTGHNLIVDGGYSLP